METTTHNESDVTTSLTEQLRTSVTSATTVTSRFTSEEAGGSATQGSVSVLSELMSKLVSETQQSLGPLADTASSSVPLHRGPRLYSLALSPPQEEVTSYVDGDGPDVSQYVTETGKPDQGLAVRNTTAWRSQSSSVGADSIAYRSGFPGEVTTEGSFSWESRSSSLGDGSVADNSGFAGEVSTLKTFSRPHTDLGSPLQDSYTDSGTRIGQSPSLTNAASTESPLSFSESERLYSALLQENATQEKADRMFSTQRSSTTQNLDVYSALREQNSTYAESKMLNSATQQSGEPYSTVPQQPATYEESEILRSTLPQYNFSLNDSEMSSTPQQAITRLESDSSEKAAQHSTIVSTDSGNFSQSWRSLFNTLFTTDGGHSNVPSADPISDTTTATTSSFLSTTAWNDPTNTTTINANTTTTNISFPTNQDATSLTRDVTSSRLWDVVVEGQDVANVTEDVMDLATSGLWDVMTESQDVVNVTKDVTTSGLWDVALEGLGLTNVTENTDAATSEIWDVVVKGLDVDETSSVLALKVTSLAMLAVGGVLGNALVIWSVVRQRHLHRPPFYYLLSLSLTDLSRAAFCLPLVAMTLLQGSVWRHGDSACDLFAFANAFFVLSSAVSLLDVAADRHLSLLYSRSYRRRAGGALNLVVVLLGWSLAFLVAFPPVLGVGGYAFEASEGQCTLRHRSFRHDNDTLGFLLVFSGLTLITLFLYSRVFLALRAHRKMRPLEHEPARSATWTFVGPGANGQAFINWVNGFGGITMGPGANLARNPPRPNLARVVNLRVARNQHVTRLFFLMTLTFHLLWLPYQVLSYWRVFGAEGRVRSGFATSAAWLSYGQVLVCPLVYFAARGPSRRRPSRTDVSPHDKQEVLLESVHRKK